jgi:transketolase
MVHEARKALPKLQEQGIMATLVDLYSLPFDHAAIARLARENQGNVLTLEDNYGAGLGSAVAEVLCEYGGIDRFKAMYVQQIPKSGRTPNAVLRYLGLDADAIVQTAVGMVQEVLR